MQRQYTGSAGRIENAQVAVYLSYASAKGHVLMDRALYLPGSWTGDGERLAAAGTPGDVGFATKPALARAMIIDALAAGVPASRVAGDEAYGADTVASQPDSSCRATSRFSGSASWYCWRARPA